MVDNLLIVHALLISDALHAALQDMKEMHHSVHVCHNHLVLTVLWGKFLNHIMKKALALLKETQSLKENLLQNHF